MFFCVLYLLYLISINITCLFQIEEEDPDILALREMALSSLAGKKKAVPQQQPHTPVHYEQLQQSPVMHDPYHTPNRLPLNGGYNGLRPPFPNPDRFQGPVHQQMFNPMFHQLPRPSFAPGRPPFQGRPPMIPPIQPHVNPHFMNQHNQLPPSMFGPGPGPAPMLGMVPMSPADDMPVLPDNGVFVPTPPSRLSPRSAQ